MAQNTMPLVNALTTAFEKALWLRLNAEPHSAEYKLYDRMVQQLLDLQEDFIDKTKVLNP